MENTLAQPELWLMGVIILLLLVCSAFFSGSETALTAASRPKLHAQADKGSRAAGAALALKEDGERLIGAILLGNNIANILATSLATVFFTALFGEGGVAVATLVMTALVVVFAEIAPKNYAISAPERAAMLVAPVISRVTLVFAPIVGTITRFVRSFLRALGASVDPDTQVYAQEEIKGTIDLHHSEGAVQKDDRDRLLAALDLKNREIDEIMLHRQAIEMIDADAPPAEILSQCLQSPYTRIPVFKDDPENIVGVVHAKDLLRNVDRLVRGTEGGEKNLEDFKILEVAMKPYFVPDTTTLDDQMREFLRRRTHFALVIDEYGALRGLITLEDILEEIVGEISDEHDREEVRLRRARDGSLVIDGGMTIRDLNRTMDWPLPDEEANTVAGLVIHEAQMIPTEGQVFTFHGFRFEVLKRERNRLTRLKVRRISEPIRQSA